jgi:polyferredoxin
MGRWRALVLILVHLAIAARIAHWKLTGSAITPLEPSEAGLAASEGLLTAGFFFFLLLILSTLVLGRWFCGWGCHVVALQDACGALLARLGLRPRPLRARLLVWIPAVAALELFLAPALLRLWRGEPWPSLRVHLVTEDFWARFPGPAVALLTLAVCGGVCVWALGNKGFCTYACPYGALFGFADRFAPGRIRVTDACEGCGHCTAVCSSNVRVHQEVRRFGMVVDAGCMKCLDCVSACPKEALYFGFGKLPDRSQRRAAEPKRFDFSLAEELCMLGLFVAALYAFRNLYGRVPFLLALALASLTALGLALLWRLARRADLRFQHLTLKRSGRLAPAGFAAILPLLGWPAFSLHSGLLQYEAREGQRLLIEAGKAEGAARRALVERAGERLLAVDARRLLSVPDLQHQLGAIELELGRPESALARLESARLEAPRSLAVLDKLAGAQAALGRERELELSLARGLALLAGGDGARAEQQAQSLANRAIEALGAQPGAEEPRLLLCWIQALLGDLATARDNAARRASDVHSADWAELQRFLDERSGPR